MDSEIFRVIVVSFLSAAGAAWLIVRTNHIHGKFSLDSDMSGTHKFHSVVVPRIGGIAFFIGLVVGSIFHGLQADDQLHLSKWAGVAALPVFLGGLLEDVFKKISPRDRLLLAFLSAAIGFYELDIGLTSINWPAFDEKILSQPGVSLLLTIVMVGGVAHSTNIIDGFHGLLLGISIMSLGAFIWVMTEVGDDLLKTYAGIMLGALLGVFLLNYPKGKIFLGDGGAYLIGFLLAILALLLIKRHPTISPWFPLLVLSYPVVETIFSIIRKKMISKQPAMSPDNLHLHMLVYQFLSKSISQKIWLNQNAATAIIMWIIALTAVVPAIIWWGNTSAILFFFVVFCVLYSCMYAWLFRKVDQVR